MYRKWRRKIHLTIPWYTHVRRWESGNQTSVNNLCPSSFIIVCNYEWLIITTIEQWKHFCNASRSYILCIIFLYIQSCFDIYIHIYIYHILYFFFILTIVFPVSFRTSLTWWWKSQDGQMQRWRYNMFVCTFYFIFMLLLL